MRLLESDKEFALRRAKKILSVYKTGEISCTFKNWDDENYDFKHTKINFEYEIVSYDFHQFDDEIAIKLQFVNLYNPNCRVKQTREKFWLLVIDDINNEIIDNNDNPTRDLENFRMDVFRELSQQFKRFDIGVVFNEFELVMVNKETRFRI